MPINVQPRYHLRPASLLANLILSHLRAEGVIIIKEVATEDTLILWFQIIIDLAALIVKHIQITGVKKKETYILCICIPTMYKRKYYKLKSPSNTMTQNKLFKFSRISLIIRLVIYFGFLGLSMWVFHGDDSTNFLTTEIILSMLVLGIVLSDLAYCSKDIVLTEKSVILISFSYRMWKFPKKEELSLNTLRQVEVSDLFAHGILVKFTTNKTYMVFAGDILTLADFIDELKIKIPKTCKIYD